jgi:arylsulfatase A-like enzyme
MLAGSMIAGLSVLVDDYADEWFTPHPERNNISVLSEPLQLPVPRPPLGYKPNFVLVLTDDQDRYLDPSGYTALGSLAAMPQLRREMLHKGAIVDHFYVNTPICCPSRTELFSGRYFHNVGPPNDAGSCMHADTANGYNASGLFGLMTRAGYNTGGARPPIELMS